MKQNIFWLLVLGVALNAMEAPQKAIHQRPNISWINDTDGLKNALQAGASEQAVQKRVLINKGPRLEELLKNIVLMTHKPGAGGKLVVLFVYEGAEKFHGVFDNPSTDGYKELGYLMAHIAQKRFEPVQEKGALARAINPEVQQITQDIRLISYAYGLIDSKKDLELQKNEKAALLVDFIASLLVLYGQDIKLVIVAKGESTDIVNRATHKAGTTIDTLLYFQAPIYEWEWKQGLISGEYAYNAALAPASFTHLYHLYSKSGWTSTKYPERKFKQQAKMERNQLAMPVKNVRALKVVNDSLDDFTDADFLQSQAIKKYPALIDQIDNYAINFDLLAKVYDQGVQSLPAVAINRFVIQKGNQIVAPYGSSLIGKEYFYDILPASPALINNIKQTFSTEVQESLGQLINITSIPAPQGWGSFVLGSLQGDIDRIKKQYDLVLQSPLHAFTIPAQAQQFAHIITPAVRAEFEKINKLFNISSDYAFGQMQLGALYTSYLLQGNVAAIPTNTQEAYIRSIIAIIWYLYALALEKNQGFEEGTFVIEDINFVLYNFLMGYVRRFGDPVTGQVIRQGKVNINQPLRGTIEDPALNMSYNLFAYPRESSHFKESQKTFRHYGIDIRFGMSAELPLLPADKRHILFGKVDEAKQLIFIKPENFGIYYKDGFLYHGSEFIESVARKSGFTKRTDDDPMYRKERIPDQFIKDFDVALRQANIQDKQRAELEAILANKEKGIKAIYFDDLMSKPAIQELEQKYRGLYDHLDMRIGREVIIRNQKLRSLLPQQAP
ncbi:hypothetical protein BH09DEP1_BH09DEP1_5230 [soil metagenome]